MFAGILFHGGKSKCAIIFANIKRYYVKKAHDHQSSQVDKLIILEKTIDFPLEKQ